MSKTAAENLRDTEKEGKWAKPTCSPGRENSLPYLMFGCILHNKSLCLALLN